MDINKEDLQYSIEYFDKLVVELMSNPPEDFNVKSFAKHFNAIKNALAYYTKED